MSRILTLIGGLINGSGNALNNTIQGTDAANTLNGGAGNDGLIGLGGNDILNGGPGNDAMFGGAGDDIYEVDSTGDTISDASGTDLVRSTISYTLSPNDDNLALRGSTPINGTGNEFNNAIIGNSGTNVLSGLDGNDVLLGEGGGDFLNGGNGNDELSGGPGADSLTGGAGNDFYSYRNPSEGGDNIFGFVQGLDKLAFLAGGFGPSLSPGQPPVAGTTFIANPNPAPTTTQGTFLYDTDAFQLSWDADGTGFLPSVLIAQFGSGVVLAPTDFLIV